VLTWKALNHSTNSVEFIIFNRFGLIKKFI